MGVTPRACLRCRAEIPAERLEALPDTQLCVTCSQAVGSDYEVKVVPVNVGKSGSLKKNYGSYSVRKKRRTIVPLEEQE